jgi:monomeric isocitrate dehydrogenase
MTRFLILITLIVSLGCSERRQSAEIPPEYLGEWTAYSRNHMSISGDMVVKEQSIDFALKGTVSYEIIEVRGDEIYLKIDKDVDAGLFMRLGPSKVSDYRS